MVIIVFSTQTDLGCVGLHKVFGIIFSQGGNVDVERARICLIIPKQKLSDPQKIDRYQVMVTDGNWVLLTAT